MEKSFFGISDIHTEFYKEDEIDDLFKSLEIPSVDYLILAGDIGNPTTAYFQYVKFLELCKGKAKKIFLVPGNHEYYNSAFNMDAIDKKLKRICNELNISFLQNETESHDGITFIGTTLWSLIEKDTFKNIGDFRYKVFRNHIDYCEKFFDSLKFLRKMLEDIKTSCVVITHHLPLKNLIHSRYRDSELNTAFYTDILYNLNLKQVKFWFCGHSHETTKFRAKENLFIIVNPVGYRDENRVTKTFKEKEIIRLE